MNTNSYTNQVAYAAEIGSIEAPAVSYIEDQNRVIYNQNYHAPTEDKTKAQVGDLVFMNDMIYNDDIEGDQLLYMDPKDPKIPMMLENDVCYGVVVIPTNHTNDGSVRVVSIDFMDYNNTNTGSNKPVDMSWGPSNNLLTMDTSDKIVTIVSGTTTVTLNSFGYFATDYHKVSAESNFADAGTYWDYNAISNDAKIPSTYTNDGTVEAVHGITTGQITAYGLNGLANTNTILANSTLASRSNSVTNESISGHYPAAECCSLYKADDEVVLNSESGKFYLPSILELAYLVARFEKIENSRFIAGGRTMANKSYWSSSLSSSNLAWLLDLYLNGSFGDCLNYNKGYYGSVLAFVAF